jgi:predicted RNase H-like HicB family nuclease
MQYKIRLKKSEEGYAAWCEDLPGCASQGDTEDEAMQNIKEAIEDYIIILRSIN